MVGALGRERLEVEWRTFQTSDGRKDQHAWKEGRTGEKRKKETHMSHGGHVCVGMHPGAFGGRTVVVVVAVLWERACG